MLFLLACFLQDDKYMQHGQMLLAVQQSPVPLERLLAVAKLAVTFLTDLLRPSNDTQVTSHSSSSSMFHIYLAVNRRTDLKAAC